MPNIPLRPTGVKLYAVFLTPYGAAARQTFTWDNWDFANQWKLQIDAAKAVGANTIVFFCTVQSSQSNAALVAKVHEIMGYIYCKGMYAGVYLADNHSFWATGGSATPTNAQACVIMAAVATELSKWDNLTFIVTEDEPFLVEDTSAPLVSDLTDQYNAVKAVTRSNIPVCSGCCPGAFSGATIFSYSGQQQTNTDSVANISDVWVFHPFYTPAVSCATDSSALRAAYPGKEIAMPSAVNMNDGDAGIAARIASLEGAVGADGFRLFGYWVCVDFPIPSPANTLGLVDPDFTFRTTKTNAFAAAISGPLSPVRPRNYFPGNPRLNQRLRWQFAA